VELEQRKRMLAQKKKEIESLKAQEEMEQFQSLEEKKKELEEKKRLLAERKRLAEQARQSEESDTTTELEKKKRELFQKRNFWKKEEER